MSNGFRYDGSERFYGVPARDITQAEYERLTPRLQRAVVDSPAYKAKGGTPPKSEPKSKPEPKTEPKAEPTAAPAADSKDGA